MNIEKERKRRIDLWDLINEMDTTNLNPGYLRELEIYGGASGIWVNKKGTQDLSEDGNGVTISVLHTGRHYPDDLSEDGMFYHYPNTNRPPVRDKSEIAASKNAALLGIPVFVILPGQKTTTRSLKLGFIESWDDDEEIFLIMFGEERPIYEKPENQGAPFKLKQKNKKKGSSVTKTRPHQIHFRHHVMSRYGYKCAVCSIRHKALIHAAHICGVDDDGSDDWRNGIPLCGTHHLAFDEHLFCFDPENNEIKMKPGITASSISISEIKLKTKKEITPHFESLTWRFRKAFQSWGSKS